MPTKFPVFTQRRKHRAKRVNKKWMKRYGFKCNDKGSTFKTFDFKEAKLFIVKTNEHGERVETFIGYAVPTQSIQKGECWNGEYWTTLV